MESKWKSGTPALIFTSGEKEAREMREESIQWVLWRIQRRVAWKIKNLRRKVSRAIYPQDYELLIKLLAEKVQKKK